MKNIPNWMWITFSSLAIALLFLITVHHLHLVVSQDLKPSQPQNTISMSAEGKVSAIPDLAQVDLGVLTTASTAKKAQDDNTAKANAIIEFVKKQGIDPKDVVTTQLSVYPTFDYSKGNGTVTGYQATQTVSVKIRGVDKSTEAVGKIIDGATTAGANQVQGVNLTFENSDNLRQQARKIAIDKAKAQAQELAEQAGIKLGRVISISEGSNGYPTPMPYGLGMGGAADAKSIAPTISNGSQDVTASITLTFEVK